MSLQFIEFERLKDIPKGGCQGCPFAGNCAPCKPQREVATQKVGIGRFEGAMRIGFNSNRTIYASEMSREAMYQASLTEVFCRTCGKKYRPANELSGCPHCRGVKV